MAATLEHLVQTQLKPCVFFDRDGIVNRSPGPGYVERWEDFHLLPEFVAALKIARARGYEAVVVTNQRGVGLGRMTQTALDHIHDNLRTALGEYGLHLRDIISCVDRDDDHPNRKPNPGMLLDAANSHHLDLKRSWMVGDHERDVLAGQRAGCRTVLVGHGEKPSVADYRIASMIELPAFLDHHLAGTETRDHQRIP